MNKVPNDFVCDSSSLISLSETCNIDALRFLKQKTKANFFVTPAVEKEIVKHPLAVKQYAFSAVRLQKLFSDKTVQLVSFPELEAKAREVVEQANSLLSVGGRQLRILHEGEAECLAALKSCGVKNLAVDEKTTRLLLESPETLVEKLRSEYKDEVLLDEGRLAAFRKGLEGVTVIRSTELLTAAFFHGFFEEYAQSRENAFHASLYALQAAGCSISSQELGDYEKIRE